MNLYLYIFSMTVIVIIFLAVGFNHLNNKIDIDKKLDKILNELERKRG